MQKLWSAVRRIGFLPALLLTVFLFASCGKIESQERVIHIATGSMVKTLDPALAEDLASRNMAGALYDTLLEYDYVKRPYCLKPSMLEKMPEALENGQSYRFTLRDDLYFTPDKCFESEGNSLTARKVTSSDVIFSLLRIADGKLNSPVFWLLRGKVKGIDEFYHQSGECASYAEALKLYDTLPEGFKIIDDRTFIIRLNAPDPRFLYNLAIPYTGIVSRKAVKYYGQEAMADHPVGSGPFKLESFKRDYQIVLLRNTEYREEYFADAENPADRTRRLPLADKIICSNIRQNFTSWLLFLQGELDISALNKDNSDVVSGGGSLAPALRERNIELIKNSEFEIQYVGFSFSDERLRNNLKLRQALTAAYNVPQRIKHANDLAIPAIGPIPPGVAGFDPALQQEMIPYDLTLAKKLLAEAGYPNGIDPATGQPLEITFDQSGNSTRHRQMAEMTAADWGQLGIKVTINLNNPPRFYQKLRKGEVQTFRLSWIGDYPDAENFLQLFYSRNAGGANRVGFSDRQFDAMFEKILPMADSPERTRLYEEMARYLVQQSPWIFESQPVSFQLKHAWLENYRPHDFACNRWKYWSVDNQRKAQQKKNFRPLSFQELRQK
ncbi:MAG: hypothetical protein E7047_07120 [Lentisphaerae bacterium]|nr:hypothetical protein [Lentisphaerota bacterium]